MSFKGDSTDYELSAEELLEKILLEMKLMNKILKEGFNLDFTIEDVDNNDDD